MTDRLKIAKIIVFLILICNNITYMQLVRWFVTEKK